MQEKSVRATVEHPDGHMGRLVLSILRSAEKSIKLVLFFPEEFLFLLQVTDFKCLFPHLQDQVNEAHIVGSFFIVFCTTLTLCLVFVPKVSRCFFIALIKQNFVD